MKYADEAFGKLSKEIFVKDFNKGKNNMENLIGKFGSTQWEPPIDKEDANGTTAGMAFKAIKA